MKSYGFGIVIVGLAFLISAIFAVRPNLSGSDIINFGNLQIQGLIFEGGCALIIAGSVVAAIGVLMERITVLHSNGDVLRRLPLDPSVIGSAICMAIMILIFSFAMFFAGSEGGVDSSPAATARAALETKRAADEMANMLEAEADRLEAERAK